MVDRRSGVRTATVCAVLLGLAGLWLLATALDGRTTPTRAAEVRRATATAVNPTPETPAEETAPAGDDERGGIPDLVDGPVLPESRPVSVGIPRLEVSSRLVDLGLDAAGAMEVPRRGAEAGWYALGPTPGALGPAVIAGHVDWDQRPAVFSRLHEVRPGDRVEVHRADGGTVRFAVTSVVRYPKARFPTRAVYGSIDHAGLRLITCGGDFDTSDGHYVDNVVVFARLVTARGDARPERRRASTDEKRGDL